MALVIFFIVYFFLLRRKFSVFGVLLLFIPSTVLLSFIVNNNWQLLEFKDYINMIYTFLILFIIVYAFKDYYVNKAIGEDCNQHKIKVISIIVGGLGIIALLINIFIVYKSILFVTSGSTTIQNYKNEGGAAEMLKVWVPQSLLIFTHLFSPVGYIALGLHFYKLTRREYKKSLFYFIISLNIALHGLHGLSRSSTTLYILIYLFSLLSIFPTFSSKLKRKIILTTSLVIIGIGSVLIAITVNRFDSGSYSYYDSRIPKESIIQDKSLYSVVDYLTQWNYNGIETLRNFSKDKKWHGKASTPIVSMFSKKVLGEKESYVDVRKKTLGPYASAFNGLVSTLVYDFGYLGALCFALLFYFIVRRNRPKDGYVSFARYMNFSILIAIPAIYFTSLVLSGLIFSIAIVYIVLLNMYFKFTLILPSNRLPNKVTNKKT